MSSQRAITAIIDEDTTDNQLREDLRNLLQIRDFAARQLHLPDNSSYKTYVDLKRPYVVWNVFAAPELALEPVKSCFLIVGCLQYKGFFKKQDAEDFARNLRHKGYDVFVGGVSAYSTLGWFDDPVLSSMLRHGELRLAEVIFHELAHQFIYVNNDSAFNEAFATTIGQEGVRRWLLTNQRHTDLKKYQRDQAWEEAFIELLLSTKNLLERLYTSSLHAELMRHRKRAIFGQLTQDYFSLKSQWDNPPDYDTWMNTDLNNAKIASIVTYHDHVAAFRRLLNDENNNLPGFYRRVRHLSQLDKALRSACLDNSGSSPKCAPD